MELKDSNFSCSVKIFVIKRMILRHWNLDRIAIYRSGRRIGEGAHQWFIESCVHEPIDQIEKMIDSKN